MSNLHTLLFWITYSIIMLVRRWFGLKRSPEMKKHQLCWRACTGGLGDFILFLSKRFSPGCKQAAASKTEEEEQRCFLSIQLLRTFWWGKSKHTEKHLHYRSLKAPSDCTLFPGLTADQQFVFYIMLGTFCSEQPGRSDLWAAPVQESLRPLTSWSVWPENAFHTRAAAGHVYQEPTFPWRRLG